MSDKTGIGLSDWTVLGPDGVGPLQRFALQVRNYKRYLGGIGGVEVRLHLQDQCALQEESAAVLRRARVGRWFGHGTGVNRR